MRRSTEACNLAEPQDRAQRAQAPGSVGRLSENLGAVPAFGFLKMMLYLLIFPLG